MGNNPRLGERKGRPDRPGGIQVALNTSSPLHRIWCPGLRGPKVGNDSNRGARMRTFVVTFYKVVPDGRGRDHRALQRQAVVAASHGEAAADAAKALFCEGAGIVDWRLRADTCEVIELA